MGWPGGLVEGARASHKVYGAPPSTTLLEAHTRVRDDTTSLAETENSWAEGEIHGTDHGAELAAIFAARGCTRRIAASRPWCLPQSLEDSNRQASSQATAAVTARISTLRF